MLVINEYPATQWSGPVTEAIDRVPCGRLSHLIVGRAADVGRITAQVCRQFAGARIVAQNGQGEDHYEVVIHRPHSAVGAS